MKKQRKHYTGEEKVAILLAVALQPESFADHADEICDRHRQFATVPVSLGEAVKTRRFGLLAR